MRRRASAARAGRLPAVLGPGQIRQVRLAAAGAGLGTWHGITTAPAVAGAHIRSGLRVQPADPAIEAPTRTTVASRDERQPEGADLRRGAGVPLVSVQSEGLAHCGDSRGVGEGKAEAHYQGW